MKKLKITNKKNNNLYSLVDDITYKKYNRYTWILRCGYVGRVIHKGNKQIKTILLHREIMNAKSNELIDHINRDKLDNQKSNLRFCNRSKNAMNCKIHSHNTSGYKGVSYLNSIKKWRAYIVINDKQINLGCFSSKEDAAIAYNNAAIKYFKEFASLNKINV